MTFVSLIATLSVSRHNSENFLGFKMCPGKRERNPFKEVETRFEDVGGNSTVCFELQSRRNR